MSLSTFYNAHNNIPSIVNCEPTYPGKVHIYEITVKFTHMKSLKKSLDVKCELDVAFYNARNMPSIVNSHIRVREDFVKYRYPVDRLRSTAH
jgi:hypothetical protein